jgi:hypothetical protein
MKLCQAARFATSVLVSYQDALLQSFKGPELTGGLAPAETLE